MALRLPLSSLRWRTRLTLWFAALCAGLAVVAFAKLAEHALALFAVVVKAYPWLPIALTPTIGMACVWLTIRYFPGIQGSGIPQVIVATRQATLGRSVSALVSLRIAFGKIVLGAFALTGGFSAGREGPSVQVAASILNAAHRFLPHSRALRQRDLLVAGGAAGVAPALRRTFPAGRWGGRLVDSEVHRRRQSGDQDHRRRLVAAGTVSVTRRQGKGCRA